MIFDGFLGSFRAPLVPLGAPLGGCNIHAPIITFPIEQLPSGKPPNALRHGWPNIVLITVRSCCVPRIDVNRRKRERLCKNLRNVVLKPARKKSKDCGILDRQFGRDHFTNSIPNRSKVADEKSWDTRLVG